MWRAAVLDHAPEGGRESVWCVGISQQGQQGRCVDRGPHLIVVGLPSSCALSPSDASNLTLLCGWRRCPQISNVCSIFEGLQNGTSDRYVAYIAGQKKADEALQKALDSSNPQTKRLRQFCSQRQRMKGACGGREPVPCVPAAGEAVARGCLFCTVLWHHSGVGRVCAAGCLSDGSVLLCRAKACLCRRC